MAYAARLWVSLAGLMIVGCTSDRVAKSGGPPSNWVTLGGSTTVVVEVERALYERPGTPHFFVHVRVINKGATPLGIDLRSRFGVFYPNQWGASAQLHRAAIDETRAVFAPLNAAAEASIAAAYRAGLLTSVPAGSSVDYYEDFNASERRDVDAQARGFRYVLVVMDGQLSATDGTRTERLAPQEDAREVAIDAPVVWRRVPTGAIVLQE